jgi:hypothetical protein
MPNWKKLITSGSDAALNSLNVSTSLTASGLIYPTSDNGEESFIQTDGSGNLSLQYVKTIYEEVVNGELTNLTKGTPVYISGSIGAAGVAYRADAGDPLKMPVVYIVADTIAPTETGRGIALGLITGVDTTGFPAGTEIYVSVGGGFTSTRPTGSAIVQSLGFVTKEGAGGMGVVLNPGPNSLPNIQSGYVWVGDSNSYPIAIPSSSIQNVVSASYALTASFANDFIVSGTLTAQKLVVQTISSSVVYSSGSNIFGNDSSNTQQFTGSVLISGSLFVGLPNTIPTDETTNEVLVLNTTTGRVGRRFAAATSGTSGTSGINGTSGTSGTSGNSGTSGVNGTSGSSGSSGSSGVNGTSGSSGSSGSSGVNGTSGSSGVNGSSGSSGSSGVNGTSGSSGVNGTSGTSGVNGISGTSGSSGSSGVNGTSGTSGVNGSNAGITSYTNPLDNRVLTSVDTSTINAEANLTFNGSVLNVNGNVEAGGQFYSPSNAKGSSGAGTVTFNWNDGNIQTVTLTGNCTFAFSNPQSGASYQIIITQDGTGSRTINFPTIHWVDKTIPALTGTANSKDIVTLTYDGTNYNGVIAKNFGTP